jgi:hypothetical protein
MAIPIQAYRLGKGGICPSPVAPSASDQPEQKEQTEMPRQMAGEELPPPAAQKAQRREQQVMTAVDRVMVQ